MILANQTKLRMLFEVTLRSLGTTWTVLPTTQNGITRRAKQSANLSSLVIMINTKVASFMGSAPADCAEACLMLQQLLVRIRSQAVFTFALRVNQGLLVFRRRISSCIDLRHAFFALRLNLQMPLKASIECAQRLNGFTCRAGLFCASRIRCLVSAVAIHTAIDRSWSSISRANLARGYGEFISTSFAHANNASFYPLTIHRAIDPFSCFKLAGENAKSLAAGSAVALNAKLVFSQGVNLREQVAFWSGSFDVSASFEPLLF